MKRITLVITLFALTFTSTAFARALTVPFFNRSVATGGMQINYNLAGKYPQKLVCVFENFYKGYLRYTENNAEQESGIAFGDGQSGDQFYFSHQGKRWEKTQGGDSLDQFHVDAKGYLFVKNTNYHSKAAFATCFYIPEEEAI